MDRIWRTLVLCAVVLSPAVASTTLPDPGPLCAGQIAVLTCSVADGVTIRWRYRDEFVGSVISLNEPPPPDPVTVGDVQFTRTLSQNNNPLTSQLSFIASLDMDGGVVRCQGSIPDGTFPSDEVTLQVEMIYPAPAEVRVVDAVNGSGSSTVTIEWTPPTALVQYTTTTTPVPTSPTMSVTTTPPTTDPIQMDIIVEYNRNYTITVSIETCAGPRQTTTTVFIANCFAPVLSRGVVLLSSTSTFAGGVLMYNCSEGFQPGTVQTSVCADNGQWEPNTTLHTCTVDCGVPLFPSNSTNTTVSGTTVGAMATFQCEEGLIPSGPTTSTCTDTETGGQWLPNPADTQCNDSTVTTMDMPTTTTDVSEGGGNVGGSTATTAGSGSDDAPVAIGGAVGGLVVAGLGGAIIIVIIICVRRKKGYSSKKTSRGELELQEQPMMEYNTIGSRGYQPDSATTDEYSTVQHNRTPQHKPALEAEYSLVGSDDRTTTGVNRVAEGAGYSVLNANQGVPAVTYAALSLAPPNIPPPVEDTSGYKMIDHLATAKLEGKKGPGPDSSLDSNMMVIQIREAVKHWRAYGKALGVPEDKLQEIEEAKLEDLPSMVEVAECWLDIHRARKSRPTWRAVATALQKINYSSLAQRINMVYTTGKLPISEKDINELPTDDNAPPPPLPPKMDDLDLDEPEEPVPKPQPRVGSLKQPPPRPPKSGSVPSAPPRPPKSSPAQPLVPARPPKPST